MTDIGVSMPKSEDWAQIPIYKKFIGDILANQSKVMEAMQLFEVTSETILEPKIIQKEETRGSPTYRVPLES